MRQLTWESSAIRLKFFAFHAPTHCWTVTAGAVQLAVVSSRAACAEPRDTAATHTAKRVATATCFPNPRFTIVLLRGIGDSIGETVVRRCHSELRGDEFGGALPTRLLL